MSTNAEKVAAQIRQSAPEGQIDTLVTFPEGNHGVVLADRGPAVHDRWAVWFWATSDTARAPIATPTGAILWSGGFYSDRSYAEHDLARRPRPRP